MHELVRYLEKNLPALTQYFLNESEAIVIKEEQINHKLKNQFPWKNIKQTFKAQIEEIENANVLELFNETHPWINQLNPSDQYSLAKNFYKQYLLTMLVTKLTWNKDLVAQLSFINFPDDFGQ